MKFVACFVSLQLCHCDNSVHAQMYKEPAFSGNQSEYEKVMAKILEQKVMATMQLLDLYAEDKGEETNLELHILGVSPCR